MPKRRAQAFTMLELLCVVAVIGILAAMLFPALSATRRAAERAKTKTQFNQWVGTVEAFRREYGYYPSFDASNLVNGGASTDEHVFHDVLAARQRRGGALIATSAGAVQNRKLIAFRVFGDDEIDEHGLIRDASGSTSIAVLIDRDLDGVIKEGADFASLPSVAGMTPGEDIFPVGGVRAGVAFYSPAPGAPIDKPAFVTSWR